MSPIFFSLLLLPVVYGLDNNSITESPTTVPIPTTIIATVAIESSSVSVTTTEAPLSCTCGVFLSGQFKKGSKELPKGNPVLLHEQADTFPCTVAGGKMCTNKCLDLIVKHLPNSPNIICGAIDRNCNKERAYLFIKNCKDEWINSNLSAGREYCCKDGIPYKCPLIS